MNFKKIFNPLLIFIIVSLLVLISACDTDIVLEDTSTDQESLSGPIPTPTVTPMPLPLNIHHQSEYFTPIMGLCEDYPKGTPVNDIERDFALMKSYGIKHMRVSIAWGDYEPRKNIHDWTLLDKKVELAEKYGIELYPYICYSPSWATGGQWKDPVNDLDDWYEFVFKVADRYKGRISHWELWNEGDNSDFWSGTWAQQLELIKVGSKAVKDADPNARTIFGGLTNLNQIHVNSIFTSNSADYIDIINIHFYNETWSQSPTEDIYKSTKQVADMIRRHGGKQELWIAEIGYGDYVREDGSITDWTKIRAPYEKTRHFQAVTFVRSVGRILATNDVSNILWYEIKNLRLDSVAIGEYNNYFLGAIDHDYFPKHLWFALSFTYNLFSDPYITMDEEVNIKGTAREPFVHVFMKENGDVILLAWNRGLVNETIEIEIPGNFKQALSYSATGEKSAVVFEENQNSITFDLILNPENMHIIEIFADREIPARLTISEQKVSVIQGDTYEISAMILNLGEEISKDITCELFLNPGLKTENNFKIIIDEFGPGEEKIISWQVEIDNIGKEPQAWVAINDYLTPIAAVLFEIQ